jgi:hypothetical protein
VSSSPNPLFGFWIQSPTSTLNVWVNSFETLRGLTHQSSPSWLHRHSPIGECESHRYVGSQRWSIREIYYVSVADCLYPPWKQWSS